MTAKTFWLALGAAFMASPAAGQTQPAAPQPMTATDLIGLARAASPLPSPDGSEIIYKIRTANWARNASTMRTWRTTASGVPERLRELKGEIAWAPDGKSLAFATKPKGGRYAQIHLYASGKKVRQLTQLRSSASDITWSSDGARIYFLADKPDDPATAARIKAKDDMFAFEAPRRRATLNYLDVASGQVVTLVSGDLDVRSFSIARDAGTILLRQATSRLLDDQPRSELWILDPATGTRRRITANDYREDDARLAPDGKTALFVANAADGKYATVNARLFVIDVEKGTIRQFGEGRSWAVKDALWSGDGSEIYFTAQDGVRTNLHAVAVATGEVRPLDRCDCVISAPALSRDGRTLAFLRTSATQPAEVVRINPRGSNAPVQVTAVNDDVGKRFQLPRQEAIRWPGPEGQELEGLITYPLGYTPGRRYPLIVQSHGGPRSADQFNIFSYGRFLPLLASHGFVTLSVNYRGGTGYGDTFLQGMNGDYFRIADRDVLSGVDELVKRGIADPARLGAMGWSAGGHMTARLITVTDRFKAAIVGAGAVDWASMYLGSDTRWQRKEWFVTPPYGSQARRDLYLRNSPLASIDAVKTPTLILSGAEDRRVPPAQSVMLFRALKDMGVPTELYLAPREPHNFKELRHQLFQVNASMRWLTTYVTRTGYVPAIAPHTAIDPADDDESADEPTEPGEALE
ncbi:S9 family peptidase [Sphingomonas koreensis]|uniref:S9 family peptidase n=1 Tax=Sphingomonas koreensis TaxID=93064 RepID=UPI00083450CF|nr:S9 family peptidase [Sphingomonas koreensis]PJI87523.1 dipeptidyl aminopeptidase/acylaminoacyl peptidase [Sphingomonas koreensis]RSU62906.1 S9 family peptidase [Sphingomonas koreensis]RSU71616.1 S9 family peptidase [Sphingomonas koreensis]